MEFLFQQKAATPPKKPAWLFFKVFKEVFEVSSDRERMTAYFLCPDFPPVLYFQGPVKCGSQWKIALFLLH